MKINMLFRSVFLNVKYFILNNVSTRSVNCNPNEKKFLICMTTYIKRIERVYLTIESLIRQSEEAKIVLFLCKADIPGTGLPKSLIRLKERGLEIIIVPENVRSFKKLSFVNMVSDYRSYDYVVTVDDDIYYPKSFLSGFSKTVDGDNVYCYRAKVVSFLEGYELINYSEWPLANKSEYNDSKWCMPTGVSGVCYPVSTLDSTFFDAQSYMKICPTADDIWYKACCLNKGVNSKLVEEKSVHFTPVFYLQRDGLEIVNVGENKNTIQMAKALNYFGLNV